MSPCSRDYIPRYLHFAPPELEMWGYTNARRVVDATLTFDFNALGERLGVTFDAAIERAQTLLATSTASLGDIAQATGFADAVHFGRTFRNLVGMPPGAWRSERLR